MLTYSILKDRPREFLAATGLTHAEFARLLPAFATAYAVLYAPDKTFDGKGRQRQIGGGAKGALPQMEAAIPGQQSVSSLQDTHRCLTLYLKTPVGFCLRQLTRDIGA